MKWYFTTKNDLRKKNIKNENYIWDFYSEGGTQNLINKLNKIRNKKKLLNLVFIGNKAGLLEAIKIRINYIKKQNKNSRSLVWLKVLKS